MSQESEIQTLSLIGKLIVYFIFEIVYFVMGWHFYLLLCKSKLPLSIILCFVMEIIILIVIILTSLLSIREIKKWFYCRTTIQYGKR